MGDAFDYLASMKEKYPLILGEYLRGRTIEVAPGWRSHVEKTLDLVSWLCSTAGGSIQIGLIKAKFGGLRFQGVVFGEGTPEPLQEALSAVLWYAEAMSTTLCEQCGQHGRHRDDLTWKATLCEQHYTETKAKDPDDPEEGE